MHFCFELSKIVHSIFCTRNMYSNWIWSQDLPKSLPFRPTMEQPITSPITTKVGGNIQQKGVHLSPVALLHHPQRLDCRGFCLLHYLHGAHILYNEHASYWCNPRVRVFVLQLLSQSVVSNPAILPKSHKDTHEVRKGEQLTPILTHGNIGHRETLPNYSVLLLTLLLLLLPLLLFRIWEVFLLTWSILTGNHDPGSSLA